MPQASIASLHRKRPLRFARASGLITPRLFFVNFVLDFSANLRFCVLIVLDNAQSNRLGFVSIATVHQRLHDISRL